MSKLKVKTDSKLGKQEVLQAVVLANDFGTNLSPMQDIFPSILTPVANVHLLDYLLETLIQSGIHEVFIYCSSHIDLLKSYISSRNCTDITISLILSDGCRSLGDALRDIDAKGWIRGDFILIRGDAFINANLTQLMDHHRLKRERDKGTAMSLVLRDVGSTKNSILETEACLFVADKLNKKVLFYKRPGKAEKKIEFELQWFLEHEQIEINSGFIDTHVYMCSPAVLPLFSDNFDFQTMEDFIRNVLINEEILDARIYWHPLNSEDYGLPMTSWSTYHTLSRDILQRQGYPLTPDTISPFSGIIYTSRSTYKHKNSSLARGCILQKETIVGELSSLGKNTLISRSVIGNNCTIGNNVTIENSYILDNVTINDNCIIKNSILFSKCSLDKFVELDICIVSPEVKILTKNHYINTVIENKNSNELIYKTMTEYCNDNCNEFKYYKKNLLIDDNCENSESDDTSIEECSDDVVEVDDSEKFLSEVRDSLLRGYQDKLNCENLILEINSSRFAYDIGLREVTYNVIKAILILPLHYLSEIKESVNNINYIKTLKAMIEYFNMITMNYIKTEDAQEDCLKAIEEVASTTPELLVYSQHLLHLLYNKEILSEEKILDWYHQDCDEDDDEIYWKKIREHVKPFITWLNEAEEGSSDDDDDDD